MFKQLSSRYCFFNFLLLFLLICLHLIKESLGVKICDTSACKTVAHQIKSCMNESVDPCKNFNEFACGNFGKFVKNTLTNLSRVEIDSVTLINHQLAEKIKGYLTKSTSDWMDSKAFIIGRELFQQCMDVTDETRASGFQESINTIAKWPIIEKNKFWKADDYDIYKTLAKLTAAGFKNPLFTIEIKNSRTAGIHLRRHDAIQENSGTNDRYIEIRPRGPLYLNDTKDVTTEEKIFIQYIMWPDVIRKNNFDNYHREFAKMYPNVDAKLQKIYRDTIGYETMWYESLESLKKTEPEIPWLELIHTALSPKDFDKKRILITVHQVRTLNGYAKFINETYSDPELKKNVYNFLLYSAFWDLEIPLMLKMDSKSSTQQKSEFCYNSIVEVFALGIHTMITKELRRREKQLNLFEVEIQDEMVARIQNSAIARVFDNKKNVDFLVKEVKERTKIFNGYLDSSIANAELAEEVYSAYAQPENFVQAILEMQKLGWKFKVDHLYDTNFENAMDAWLGEFFLDDLFIVTNRLTSTWLNQRLTPTINNPIVLSIHDISEFYFHVDQPWYLNYGALGSMLGHEFTHVLYANAFGNFMLTSNKEIMNAAHCIKWYYDKGNKDTGLNAPPRDPEQSIDVKASKYQEIICDIEGMKMVYYDYDKRKKSRTDRRLPGLEKYTNKQMFWIYHAHHFCSYYPDSVAGENYYEEGTHPPHYMRINLVNSLLSEFSADFKCPANSPMNGPEKCSLFEGLVEKRT